MIIGGSVGGAFAAAALAGHGRRITVLERDVLPTAPTAAAACRRAPSSTCSCTAGCMAVEELLPGVDADLRAAGGVPLDTGEMAWLGEPGWAPLGAAVRDRLGHPTAVRARRAAARARAAGVEVRDGCGGRGPGGTAAAGRPVEGRRHRAERGPRHRRVGAVVAAADVAGRARRAARPGLAGRCPSRLRDSRGHRAAGRMAVPGHRGPADAVSGAAGSRCRSRAVDGSSPRSGRAHCGPAGTRSRSSPPCAACPTPRAGRPGRRRGSRPSRSTGRAATCGTATRRGRLAGRAARRRRRAVRRSTRSTGRASRSPRSRRWCLRDAGPILRADVRGAAAPVARAADLPWRIATGEDLRYPAAEGTVPRATAMFSAWTRELGRLGCARRRAAHVAMARVYHLMASPLTLLHPRLVARALRARVRGHAPATPRPRHVHRRTESPSSAPPGGERIR